MDFLQKTCGFTPIPHRIGRLLELAYNLWWTWHPEAQALFTAIDAELWEEVYHNPVRFLRQVRQKRIEKAAHDSGFLRHFHQVMSDFDTYMVPQYTWFSENYPDYADRTVAYFSAEFGLHEALPIYSGGLGVLSGDHCKEASDLGLPFVGVGFIYPQGYFSQQLNGDGWQEAIYDKMNFAAAPALPAFDKEGQEVVVEVELPGRNIYAKVWELQVGRVSLYLMDTDINPNATPDRELSARLYGGDREMRLSQEMVLGIGGVRALRALDINPSAWHMNEGHSAFMVLERVRELVEAGHTYEEAAEIVRNTSIFTTHTPVAAGHDEFPFDMMEKFFAGYWDRMNITRDEFMSLADHDGRFSMTVLALKLAGHHNGVSRLHGEVSRRMWRFLWPELGIEEVPISYITNGIHSETWLAHDLKMLYDEYLGRDWTQELDNPRTWEAIQDIPDDLLWQVRKILKHKMIEFTRERERERRIKMHAPPEEVEAAEGLLDPDVLTIGFARRFAPYKRATLIFHDFERFKGMVTHPEMPIQVIFSGKAHPADEWGKELIRQAYHVANNPEMMGRVVFVEDYDINVARYLVQGVDVWLNNPRRPLEASGTSGQKASLNGIPNLSILDGWWLEGYNGHNGWAVGDEVAGWSHEEQDSADAQSLYLLLEEEVIPLYYDLNEKGYSPGWMRYVKNAIYSAAPSFSTKRMVKEYAEKMYVPAAMESAKNGG